MYTCFGIETIAIPCEILLYHSKQIGNRPCCDVVCPQLSGAAAELVNLAMKNALVHRDVAHLVFPDDVQTIPASNKAAGKPAGRMTGGTR